MSVQIQRQYYLCILDSVDKELEGCGLWALFVGFPEISGWPVLEEDTAPSRTLVEMSKTVPLAYEYIWQVTLHISIDYKLGYYNSQSSSEDEQEKRQWNMNKDSHMLLYACMAL